MTDRLPELRAADSDRERVAEILRDALAEGRIDMPEFEERLEAAYKARTYGELTPLTADLPVTPQSSAAARPAAAQVPAGWAQRIGGTVTSRRAFAMWSGFRRKGRWTAPRRFTAATFQGGGKIDLREADFETPEITIRCIAVQGGIEIVVPPGVQVRVKGFALMGRFNRKEDGTGDPGAPVVNVTGFVFQGGVDTQRKATEAERQRLKEGERRATLEKQPRKELG